jgi:L-fuculose-phosphate aldolase
MKKEKIELVKIAKRMYELNFSAPTDGNISFRIKDRIFISKSSKHKAELTVNDIIEVDLDGAQVSKNGKASTETALHLKVYNSRKDIFAVVHAHPPFATAFAVSQIPLDKNTMSEIISTLGNIPLANYGTPATNELPNSLDPYVKNCNAILLANHGAITYGSDLQSAWYSMERLEHFARISFYSRLLGGEKIIPKDDVDKLLEIRKNIYKINDPLIINDEAKTKMDKHEIIATIDQLKKEILNHL